MNPFLNQAPIPGVKKIVAVGSGKGGVGKSTIALNLAMGLRQAGRQVGLLDADIFGPSLPRLTGTLDQRPEVDSSGRISPLLRHGLKLMSIGHLVDENMAVIWRGPMLFKVMEQFLRDVAWGELDDLIVDLPPGTGDVALTLAQKVPLTGAIVVCTPQNLALTDAKKAIDMFEKIHVPVLGVVENMAYLRREGQTEEMELFPRGELDTFLSQRGLRKLGRIPFHPSVGLASEAGLPVLESSPQTPEAEAFRVLSREVIGLL